MQRENNAIHMRKHSFSITDCLDYMKRSDIFSICVENVPSGGGLNTKFVPSNFLKESHHTII